MTTDTQVLNKSVTKGDHEVFGGPGGPVWFFTVPFNSIERQGMLPLEMPSYWSREGDALLRSTILREAMWSNVIFKIITRISSFGWDIEDAALSEQRVFKAQKLLHNVDLGAGWVTFISKIVRDFACTNNGAFIEIIRASAAAGSRVIGLRHLDSLRCWRTGDVNYPVIYFDLKGAYHVLKAHQVLTLVDMPSSDPLLRGVGWCAAARAYNPMVRLQYLQNYVTEKIAGTRPLALYFVNGATEDQIKTAVSGGMAQAQAEGYIGYMGAIVVPTFRPEAPQVASIDLAGLPDKADAVGERRDCYLHMAHAAGIFVGEIQPLEGQYGTGTQSTVLSEASKGQGFAALTVQLEHGFSQRVMPFTTSFAFTDKKDWRDQEQRAKVVKMRVDTRKIQIESGELSKEQAQQMAADFGDINRTFLQEDLTPNASLGDDEKPVAVGEEDNAIVTDDAPVDSEIKTAEKAQAQAQTLFLVMQDSLPLYGEDVIYTLKHLAGQHDQRSHAGGRGSADDHAATARQLQEGVTQAQRTVYDKMRAARESGSYAGISQARGRVRDAQTALDAHNANPPSAAASDPTATVPTPPGKLQAASQLGSEPVVNAEPEGGFDPATYDPAGIYAGGRTKNVEFHSDMNSQDKARIMKVGKKLLGDDFTLDHLVDVVGAPSDAKLMVYQDGGREDVISIRVEHPYYDVQIRTLFQRPGSDLEVHNDMFRLKDDAPPGTGTSVFNRQVIGARKRGVQRITTYAARVNRLFNGYYTWPRLGYDATLGRYKSNKPSLWETLPDRERGAGRLSDLMKTKVGRDFWKEHGEAMDMLFWIDEDSQSSYVLSEYVKSRMAVEQ